MAGHCSQLRRRTGRARPRPGSRTASWRSRIHQGRLHSTPGESARPRIGRADRSTGSGRPRPEPRVRSLAGCPQPSCPGPKTRPGLRAQPRTPLSPQEADERLYRVFSALEQACADGDIHGYGVATWSGFSSGLFDIPTLLGAAFRAGGAEHRLRAIQLPLSLVHLAPIAHALRGRGPLADARAAQLAVFASAPLHGGEVPGLLTPELLALITSDQATPAQVALSVVASAPGVRRVLLSTGQQEHWNQAVTALDRPVLSRQTLQRIADVLGT